MSQTTLDIEKLLESLINHKVTISYAQHEEADLRETSGVLKSFNKNIIHLELFDSFGKETEYYLNRCACTLHSITDDGEKEK